MKKFVVLIVVPLFLAVFSCSKKDTTTNPITDETRARGSISGFVYSAGGTPLSKVYVSVDADSSTPGISNADGSFKIGQVLPGTYTLKFAHRDWKSDTAIGVTVLLGQDVTLADTVRLVYAWGILSGRIVKVSTANDTTPVAGAGVGIDGTSQVALTNSDGSFTIKGIEPGSNISIVVAKSGFGFTSDTVASLNSGDSLHLGGVALTMEGGTVEGRVVDENGVPVSGLVVSTVGGAVADTTRADGTYRLRNVPTGDSRIIISAGNSIASGAIIPLSVVEGLTSQAGDISLHANVLTPDEKIIVDVADYRVEDTSTSLSMKVTATSMADSIAVAGFSWTVNNGPVQSTLVPRLDLADLATLPDTFIVTVSAVDQYGTTTTPKAITVTKVNNSISVYLTVATASGSTGVDSIGLKTGEYAYFEATIVNPVGAIASVVWNFGDGSSDYAGDSVTTAAHPYDSANIFTATVIVGNTVGSRDTASVIVKAERPAIAAPSLVFPGDGDTVRIPGNSVRLSWQAIGETGVTYGVYFDRSSPPARLADGLIDPSHQVTVEPGKTYFWKIQAVKDSMRASSPVRSFTVLIDSTVPSTDILLTPANDSLLPSWTTYLVWTRYDSLDYKVLLGDSVTNLLTIRNYREYPTNYTYSSTSTTGRLMIRLTGHKRYYWQVVIKNSAGNEFKSPVWYFKTRNQAPKAFSLVSPGNNGEVLINRPIEYKWNNALDSDPGDTIRYFILRDQGATALTVLKADIDSAFYIDSAGLPAGGATYAWRVGATDGYDTVFTTIWNMKPNTPPVFTTITDTLPDTVRAGVTTSFLLAATDAENDSRYYSADVAMPGFSISSSTVYFQPGFVGDTVISLFVRDQSSAATTFTGYDTLLWKVYCAAPAVDSILRTPKNEETVTMSSGRQDLYYWYMPQYRNVLYYGTSPDALTDTLVSTYSSSSPRQTYFRLDTSRIKGGNTYYWKVAYVDTIRYIGSVAQESLVWSFTTRNQLPSIHYPLLPADRTIVTPATAITFTWPKSVDLDGDALTYLFYLKKDVTPADSLVTAGTDTTFTITGGLPAGKYYWRVRVTDGKDTVTYYTSPDEVYVSQAPVFTTMAAQMTDSAMIDHYYIDTVVASDPDGDALTYAVVSGQYPSGLTVGSTTGIISWSPTPAQAGLSDTVKIRVYDWSRASDTIAYPVRVPAKVGNWSLVNDERGFSSSSITDLSLFKYSGAIHAGFKDGSGDYGSVWRNATTWTNSIPDMIGSGTTNPRFASDGTNLYGAFRSSTYPYPVYVMKFNGTGWDTVGHSAAFGHSSAIDLGVKSDTPFVVVRGYVTYNALTVVRFKGPSWDTIGGTAGVNFHGTNVANDPKIAFRNGLPVVAFQYQGLSPYGIAVWEWSGSAWSALATSRVSDGAGQMPAIAVDPASQTIYVAYNDTISTAGGRISVKKYSGGSWSVVGTTEFTERNAYYNSNYSSVSIAVENDIPYVSYTEDANFTYRASVLKFDGGIWKYLGHAGVTGNYAYEHKLLVDAGQPYLLFRDGDAGYKATVMTYAP